jgi:class 3 adenylate cyclase
MIFVNNLADVVHSMVDRYLGAANKNIGDAFLLVWKVKSSGEMSMMADCAMISYLKIFAKVNREPKVLQYRSNELLLARLPGYRVKLGFGLHCGWSIEGAIGSRYKIDASYLSPNVNMASKLEAATK